MYQLKNNGYVSDYNYLKQKNKTKLLRFFFKDYNFSSWGFLGINLEKA